MVLRHLLKDGIPVGAAVLCRGAQTRNRVLARGIVGDDISDLILLEASREVDVDLEEVVDVLGLEGLQQVLEPLERLRVTADPVKVHLAQLHDSVGVDYAIPDRLENGREGSDTDARTDAHSHLKLERILRRRAKRSIDVNSRESARDSVLLGPPPKK